jgi:3-hydroxyacyl-[acyl-carrier-protein] dehydratase
MHPPETMTSSAPIPVLTPALTPTPTAETASAPALAKAPDTATTVSTLSAMDIQQIMATLPHRYPFVMVDRVLEIEKNKYVRALKNVTINEPFFQGHFPARPVMPGVLMIEALAQAAAMLAFVTTGNKPAQERIVYLVAIDDARFKRPVVPGDQLILEAWLERMRGGIHRYRARASVEGKTAVECFIMCTERNAAD